MNIFTKVKNKIILSIIKSQLKKLVAVGITALEGVDEETTANQVTAFVEAFIKTQTGYTVPDSIDNIADKAVANIIDKARDYAVELLKKA